MFRITHHLQCFLKAFEAVFKIYLSNDIYHFDTLTLDTSDDLVMKAFSSAVRKYLGTQLMSYLYSHQHVLSKALHEAIYTYFSVRREWLKAYCMLCALVSELHFYYTHSLLLIHHFKNTKIDTR